ncbi:MAG: hypothetical protein NTW07_00580, partial [candidate division Zixibacteria bacterium]|nr:hypothetical protein [candidate division Zixibacteria bacterium]
MPNKPLNRSLHTAKATKQDEFYTQLSDIEKELRHYAKHFKGKTVLCNCDDPKISNFFHYFSHNFEKLKLKKLITTCYKNCDADLFSKHTDQRGIWLEYDGDKDGDRVPGPDEIGIHTLKGDGDFRSEECIKLLKQADIVVTNPPFYPVGAGRINPDHQKAVARHELHGTLSDFITAAAFLLKQSGRLFAVYPCSRITDLIAEMRQKGRVKQVPYDTKLKVHIVFDLGVGQA